MYTRGRSREEAEVHAPEPGEGWVGGEAGGVTVVQLPGLFVGEDGDGGGGSRVDVMSFGV